jgi:flagellar hook assembly protein FlgD
VIRFENPERGRVSVEIYNLSGQVISRLMDAEVPAGIHEIRWDGSTTAGTVTAEGLYFFRLHTGNGVTTGRLMRID